MNNGHCPVDGFSVCQELEQYRNTGMEPDEINKILDAYGRGQTLRTENALRLEIMRNIKTDRLREICAAERDGRCVVLPCKAKKDMPDLEYLSKQCKKHGELCKELYACNRLLLTESERVLLMRCDIDFAATLDALTRAEAEAALKGGTE